MIRIIHVGSVAGPDRIQSGPWTQIRNPNPECSNFYVPCTVFQIFKTYMLSCTVGTESNCSLLIYLQKVTIEAPALALPYF